MFNSIATFYFLNVVALQTLLQVSRSSAAPLSINMLYKITAPQIAVTPTAVTDVFGKEFVFSGKGGSCHCWPFQY